MGGRIMAAGALVVAGMLTLTGCGGAVESLVEKALEEQFGTEIDVDLDGGGISIGGEDGGMQFGGAATIPEGFPSEIALPASGLIAAVTVPNGWSLTYEGVDRAAFDGLLARWKADGFTEVVPVSGTEQASGTMGSDDWSFIYTWTDDSLTVIVAAGE